MRLDLGLNDEIRSELTQNLNIVINAAASMDFDEHLDVAIRLNTTGALLLLKLAEDSHRIESFLQVSTTTVNCDRTGYVEERLYDSGIDWQAEYTKLVSMSKREMDANHKVILG